MGVVLVLRNRVIAGTVAAGGLSLAQLVKGVSTAFNLPEPTSGVLANGSGNIRINSRAAMRANVDFSPLCSGLPLNHYPWSVALIAEGSGSVRFNGQPAARLNSKMICGAHIKSGSPNVLIGGPTVRTNFVWDLEKWTEWTLIGLGILSISIAARGAWVVGGRLGLAKFSGIVAGGLLGFEGIGQIGDAIGPGYRDILQGVAGLVLLGMGPKWAKKQAIEKRMTELRNQGHGPQRHGPKITEQQLDDRAMHGKNPETGTTFDPNGNVHKYGRNATKVMSDEAYVAADKHIRESQAYKDGLKQALADGDDRFSAKVQLEDIFGSTYEQEVFGKTRIGSANNPTGSSQTNFFEGSMKAVFQQNPNGNWDLLTMYPEPK